MPGADSLRVALLSYRSKPTCGGQGVYLRHLSRELVALGHRVEVFSGQPYPELDEGVILTKIPSLDLYRDEDPFRTPGLREYRDWIDLLEVGTMWTAGFPEPLTFSLRAYRELKKRVGDFDVVQDNQTLGYGVLGIQKLFPVVGTIHHPISVDRRIELEAAPLRRKLTMRRWYGFVRMQAKVAPRLSPILTVSESSLADIHRDFNVPQKNLRLIPLGVDTRYFHPRPDMPKRPGSIVAVASADSPMKGVATLLRAVAKLATERDVNLTVVSRPTPGGPTEKLVAELALGDRVRFVHGISDTELGELIATSEISVVPSLYEGFSLPAVEHMACGTPLVASRTGALPEVVGDAAVQVTPGDPEELAAVLRRLHDSPEERAAVGRRGYDRVMERFTWHVVAKRTVEAYHEAIRARRAG
ncbi:glycosyltransferase involved in cell wall biosynthesis [Streptosporangium becharense]|uniref:Glycosyltransferase involved in cell wall biosynthesis n=1 Tax=Streptosporangium becharense TaxID=1816182 RepID=A0A7W9MIC9_9ACTN|nr:glycosyltransferase family 4 protein [Streptosporangium becharense]MBB2914000.1 glycosyltransferase involved in cell wall biosynthesis [Streptosporangium becharense]MBB5821339.1 glycosyltransferase involved in cell wall biosynthesis [Streptosporangium becharense]